MNEYLKIKITIYSEENFIKYVTKNGISLYQIKKDNNGLICIIKNNDLDDIKKYYHVEILKSYTKKNYFNILKKNIINIINILYAILLFIILSNVIVKVNINIENKELLNKLIKELDNNNIKRLSLKKSFDEIDSIKKRIVNTLNNDIEWLEIDNIGMIYNIKVEPRKKNELIEKNDKCNIIANKSGIVTKIISDRGNVLIENNSFVKEGDVLISGNISLNEESKGDVCASGRVYAERWYSINIDIPKSIEEKKYNNKIRYNFLLDFDNREYKIFKDRLNSYDTNKVLLISLLGKKLYLLKEYEYTKEVIDLDENSLNKRVDDLIISNLDLSLDDDEKILYKNILKKEENDSRIIIGAFVTVEELISETVTY